MGGTYSLAGSSACTSCPANSNSAVSSSDVTACRCNSGYTGANGLPCTSCEPGQYKPLPGPGNCTNCSGGTYSVAQGATSEDVCTECANNTDSLPGSGSLTACLCNAGYSGPDGGLCLPCVAGFYKHTPGSGVCLACGAGKFSNASAATSDDVCLLCQANSDSIPGSTLSGCLCSPGYFGNHPDFSAGQCMACAAGRYTSSAGELLGCSMCLSGFYSSSAASTGCLQCEKGATSFEGSAVCECTPGYKDHLNGSFAGCGYSEFRLQEYLIVEFLLSESKRAPICVPTRFWPETWSASPSGGWWARVENREWDEVSVCAHEAAQGFCLT